MQLDEDALIAAVDLVGRTGATGFEVGHTADDDSEAAGEPVWYAHCTYTGMRITADEHRDPVAAAEALARRLLGGAQCQRCGGIVTLSDAGAFAADKTLADGRKWSQAEQAAAGLCRWRRYGQRWQQGCEPLPDGAAQGVPVPQRAAQPPRERTEPARAGQRPQPKRKGKRRGKR